MRKIWTATIIGTATCLLMPTAWAAMVNSIDFKNTGGFSTIEIRGDGPLTFDKQANSADKQFVIDLKGASLTKQSSRILDTSSFNSPVMLVSPYSADGDTRVVIQLREMADAQVSQEGDVISIKFPSAAGEDSDEDAADSSNGDSSSAKTVASGKSKKKKKKSARAEVSEETAELDAVEEASADEDVGVETGASKHRAASSHGSRDNLDQFLESRETRRFMGRPITLQVRGAELIDVFRLIGEASGFNMLIGDGVAGTVTLSLVDVPWDQALDVILRTKRLGAERSNNLLRIVTLTSLTQEKTEELKAKQAAESNAPRITRIFPVSYAKLSDLQGLLSKFVTGGAQAAASGGGTGTAPTGQTSGPIVTTDERTNSLIVRDTLENIDRIRKLIEVLDTQTPQILIEGKVIEASEAFSRGLSGGVGVTGSVFNGSSASQNFGALFNGGTSTAFAIPAAGTAGAGNFSFSPYTGFLPAIGRINASLAINETEGKLKVISSPRSIVLNKESANITQTTPVPRVTQTINNGVQTVTTTFDSATVSLVVTPTVTNDSSVLMQLSLTRDVPAVGGGVSSSNVSTKVIVPSGGTLVVGGIYTARTSNDQAGMPWLRKIPIIGLLMGSDVESNSRAELLYFVTPRILNSEKAGMGG